jgi:hypothetical protein
MCTFTRENKPWCYNCAKCLNYALYALAAGYVDPRFDYDRMFADSAAVAPLVEYANTGVELSCFGNAPWVAGLTDDSTFQAVCHALAKSDPDRLTGRLGASALANFYVLIVLYSTTKPPSPNPKTRAAGSPTRKAASSKRSTATRRGSRI